MHRWLQESVSLVYTLCQNVFGLELSFLSMVTSWYDSPHKWSVIQSFDAFFDVGLDTLLNEWPVIWDATSWCEANVTLLFCVISFMGICQTHKSHNALDK